MNKNNKTIKILENEKFSFSDFVSCLDVKTGDVIIYYDYYALRRPDLVEKLLDSFDVPKKIIVSQSFSLVEMPEVYQKKTQETYNRCRSKFKIFNIEERDQKRLHDRYLIIRKDDKWYILNGSNSLNGYIGKIEDRNRGIYITKASALYAYIEESMISKDIINFLNKLANE